MPGVFSAFRHFILIIATCDCDRHLCYSSSILGKISHNIHLFACDIVLCDKCCKCPNIHILITSRYGTPWEKLLSLGPLSYQAEDSERNCFDSRGVGDWWRTQECSTERAWSFDCEGLYKHKKDMSTGSHHLIMTWYMYFQIQEACFDELQKLLPNTWPTGFLTELSQELPFSTAHLLQISGKYNYGPTHNQWHLHTDIVRTTRHFLWRKKKLMKMLTACQRYELLQEDSQPITYPWFRIMYCKRFHLLIIYCCKFNTQCSVTLK